MDRRLFVLIGAMLTSGCPSASINDNNPEYFMTGSLNGSLSASPDGACTQSGGRLVEGEDLITVDLCFAVDSFTGREPCDIGEPEFFYARLEYPTDVCGGRTRAEDPELEVRYVLSGPAGEATIESVPAGNLDLASCKEGESGFLGGAEYQCEDGSTAVGVVPFAGLSYRFP